MRILSIFNTYTHIERRDKILKKLIMMYIQKSLILCIIATIEVREEESSQT